MHKKTIRIFIGVFLFVFQIMFGQSKTITGVVSDDSEQPLPGVTITKKGSPGGTVTNFDGEYFIDTSVNEILIFSYIGYVTQEVIVANNDKINVTLVPDMESLEEVVITALGIEKKKDDDLSSSTRVNTDAITRSKEAGLIQGLAGKTSNLKITRNSGDPGAGAFIQIRGQNSINGAASPLIILDGIPISNTSRTGNFDNSNTDGVSQQSRLNDISSDDIESVTVLKGAAAAAVWGTGAANGVIVIKTKSAKAGAKKVSVNIKSSIIVDRISIEFDKQDKFGQGSGGNPTLANPNNLSGNLTGNSWGDKISERSGAADELIIGNTRFVAESGNVYYPISAKNSRETFNDVNRDQVFGTGITTDNSISISFAGQNGGTFISYSNWDQQGIIKNGSSYNRQTFRINQTTKLTDKLTAKVFNNYTKIKADRIQQGSNLNGLYLGYLRTSPDFDNTDFKGTFFDENNQRIDNSHRAYRRRIGGGAPIYNNPGWTINEQDNPNTVERFVINPQLEWKIKENITLTGRYGVDYLTDNRETFFPINSAGAFAGGAFIEDNLTEKTENLNIFLSANQDFGSNVRLNGIVGFALDRNQYKRASARSLNFINPDVGDLRVFENALAQNELPSTFKEETRKTGVYGVLGGDFFNQLLVEFTARYERPSTLNEAVFYPAASVGWKFSENLPSNDVFSFGKLRLSYGEVGIEPDPYLTQTTFGPGGIVSGFNDSLEAGANGVPFVQGAGPDTIIGRNGNDNLKEERIKEYEAGVDFRFFNNKLSLGATYYDRTTEDAIININVPGSTGFTTQTANAAEIENKGVEIDLSYDIMTSGDFKCTVNANFATNRNEVTNLSGVESIFLAGFTGTSSRAVEGEAIGAIWGVAFQRDDAGQLLLDSNGFPITGTEEEVLGDPNPDWTGGVGLVLGYKGISLSAQLDTSQGNEHWEGSRGVLNFFGISQETANESVALTDLLTYNGNVIPEGTTFRGNIKDFGAGPVALEQGWYQAEGGGFGTVSEQFVNDASWTRLREVSLSYELPSKICNRLNLERISLTATGRNLVLWTPIDGFDPDLNLTGATRGRGLEYFTNPATRSYALTLNIGF